MKTDSVLCQVGNKVLYVLHMNAGLLSGNDYLFRLYRASKSLVHKSRIVFTYCSIGLFLLPQITFYNPALKCMS